MSGTDQKEWTTLRAYIPLSESTFDLELCVVEGPDRGAACLLSSGRPSPVLIGQSPTCDLRLRDRSVSRRHAAFDASSWPVKVTDLGSTNGTSVNGVSIVEAHLVGGETVRLGDTTLVAERRASGPRVRLSERGRFGRMLGESAAMRRLYPLCERITESATPVMIEGEAGTGKELLAESIHETGPSAAGPFLVVDCALRGAELARRQRDRGDAFEATLTQASGGTVLFDEIGELDPNLQRALVKALKTNGGGTRVIVATKKNLDWLVQHGRFREDLYSAIAEARIELPPLRARHGDVRLLARHFWHEDGGDDRAFPSDAIAHAESLPWPGNVRELREYVNKLLVQGAEPPAAAAPSAGAAAGASGVGAIVEELLVADVSYSEARRRLLVEFEQRYVERMMQVHHGNITRAAAASGLARRNFQLIRARRKDEG
jgi:DNA-binding NtrC family response regulator